MIEGRGKGWKANAGIVNIWLIGRDPILSKISNADGSMPAEERNLNRFSPKWTLIKAANILNREGVPIESLASGIEDLINHEGEGT